MKKLLEINPQAKGIVTSGYAEDPILKDFRAYGFADAIAKPYDLQKLGDLLDKL